VEVTHSQELNSSRSAGALLNGGVIGTGGYAQKRSEIRTNSSGTFL